MLVMLIQGDHLGVSPTDDLEIEARIAGGESRPSPHCRFRFWLNPHRRGLSDRLGLNRFALS